MDWKDRIKIWMNAQEWAISDNVLDDILTQIDITVIIPLKAELFDLIQQSKKDK